MELSRQESWGGLPFLALGDLSSRGVKPESPALAGGFFTTSPRGKLTSSSTRLARPATLLALVFSSVFCSILLCFPPANAGDARDVG